MNLEKMFLTGAWIMFLILGVVAFLKGAVFGGGWLLTFGGIVWVVSFVREEEKRKLKMKLEEMNRKCQKV